MKASFLILTLLMGLTLPLGAQQKRIYLANDDHTDYMWSADTDTYAKVFVDMLDFHLDLADQTAANAPAYRNRFNVDGSYWLHAYEERKSPAEFARLISRIKDGTVSAPLNTLVSCYGAQPAEAVLRSMYYAGRLERRYGLRFPLAVAMENQTLPLGLASLFSGAGAKYSWRGVCGCASKLGFPVLSHRPREIYWWTGHDGARVLLKWYSLGPNSFGGYWEAGFPEKAIEYADTNPRFLSRYRDPRTGAPYDVIGLFGYGGDDMARKTGVIPPPEIPGVPGLQKVVSSPFTRHFHEIAQEMSNDRRQVIVSNEQDFFADFEKEHGASLPEQSVTFGNEWDLYSASMAETSARVKRAVEKLRSAELLAAIVSLKYPPFLERHAPARDRAFHALGLYWEHNWTADGPISRPQRAAWQEQLASEIEYYVNSVHGEALIRLGGMIPRPEKADRFLVLNPLGWPVTGSADYAYSGAEEIHVVDVTTGEQVLHQLVKLNGARHLRILAREVPPTGYKVYEIRPGAGSPSGATEPAATFTEATSALENSAVKLVIERDGAIRSFIDKRRGGAELAATIDGLKLNDLAAGSDDGEPLRVENAGPVSITIRARSETGLNHDTAITLYRDSERVDIHNEIRSNFSDVRYWGFSFALENPDVHTEEVGAINLNKLASAGGDYAESHARYDHVSVNHFADITNGAGTLGVTISNADLAFGKLGRSTVEALDSATPLIRMLAGGQVDGAYLGIKSQNGHTYFLQRFSLRPHGGYSSTAAMKGALEHQNPLITTPIISKKNPTDYPENNFQLLASSHPDVLLWALKPHEDGITHGLTARFWNVSDAAASADLTFGVPITRAWRTTHIETDLESLPVAESGSLPLHFARQQIQTYRIQVAVPATPAKSP